MPATYEPIATTTLSSAASSITFSSIPSTYTDLRLVLVFTQTGSSNVILRFNSDSGTNYSQTELYGDGSSAASTRWTNKTFLYMNNQGSQSNPFMSQFDIFSYAGSTYKTALSATSEDQNGTGFLGRWVGLWRSTSAITTVAMSSETSTFASGTTATLWGIKNA